MSDKRYVFGVDVGGTAIKIGLFDTAGSLIEKWEEPTDKTNHGEKILPDISNALNEKIKARNLDKDLFIGVGLGVPGPVNEKGIVHRCVNLGWGVFNVEEALSKLINLPVKATNDANVAAFGEMWKGSGKGYKSLMFITIGTGIGGGLIINEKIVEGVSGSGGEIGHLLINKEETRACNCGNCGCVEQYASATGIVYKARQLMKEGKLQTVLRDDDALTSKKIFDEAKNGDLVALEAVENMGEVLGRALGYATVLCDPEAILIGGGVSKAGQIVIDVIEKYYKKYSFHATVNTPIILASLGNDAGIYGAAKMMIKED